MASAHTEDVVPKDFMLNSISLALEHSLVCWPALPAPGILGVHSPSPEYDMYSHAIIARQHYIGEDPFLGQQHPQTVMFRMILHEARPWWVMLLTGDCYQPDHMGVDLTGNKASVSFSRNIKQVLPSRFLVYS